MDGVTNDKLQMVLADCDKEKVASECSLAETQQITHMLGGTGPVA